MQSVFSADEGMHLLMELPVVCQTERLSLLEAYGRILAETVTAQIPVPPFAKSPFDGYAFCSADTASASAECPVTLQITEELPAGTAPTVPVTAGTAAKILTGAPVPAGADTVIKYEDTIFTADSVTISHPCQPGNIVPAGEDVMVGTVLAPCGTRITGPVMGVVAGQGIDTVSVYRRPVVSIISTGSELLSAGTPLLPRKIYSTNLYTLGGFLRDMGFDVLDGGTVVDDPEKISLQICQELERADLVITTGGASVGDYDYAEASSVNAGAKMLFRRLAFKPGGSMMAGVKDGKLILGLSGNPGAAAVGLLRIAGPYLHKLCGRKDLLWQTIQLPLKEPLKKASPNMRFLRGHLVIENGTAFFAENPQQTNGSVSSLLQCNLLAEIPAKSPPLDAGTMVKAYRIEL